MQSSMAAIANGVPGAGRAARGSPAIERAQERMIGRGHHGPAYAIIALDPAYDGIVLIEHGNGHAGLLGKRPLKPQ
jgi:hypothetical protein